MTVLEDALNQNLTNDFREVANEEKVDVNKILKTVSKGQAVIVKRTNSKPVAIGFPFRTKINVNIGTSTSIANVETELEKVKIAEKFGADTISDLSMGGNIDKIRKKILDISTLPITTVPIYQTVVTANSTGSITDDLIFTIIENHLKDGISSLVIHCGFTLEDLNKMKGKRIMGMVSKGGSYTAAYMIKNEVENPFLKNFDYLLEMLNKYNAVLNLGNAMRSGCIHDKIDEFQLNELKLNSKLAKKANNKGVQVIIESLGGHTLAKDLIKYLKLCRRITNRRPLFVSGPIPTDFAPGYDHIAAAIGGAFASSFGADYLCAITPAEHLCLPSVDDIKKGLITCRIAAHVGDSFKFGLNYLFNNDLHLSNYRFQKNWQRQFEYSIDPVKPQKKHPINEDICSMCGKYCALSISRKLFNNKPSKKF
ncbi:MAG: phosphomethylpyrimidine synthase ThiC [Promethearchaeota archaeon]|nr:MAG: phosphomethylpyrimidine synthase ThiC [Candidatus Lokiarchaeota archaeon]